MSIFNLFGHSSSIQKMNFLLHYIVIYILIVYHLKSFYTINCVYFKSFCVIQVLKEISISNIVICITLSRKFEFQFYNFWDSTIVKYKITNVLIIAFDEQSYIFSKKKSKYVLKYNIQINQTKDIVFMNKDYLQVTRSKIFISRYILELNYSIFIIDPDIYLFKNPFPYIFSLQKYDIICQGETPFLKDINNGFVLYRNNIKIKHFFENLTENIAFVSGKISFEQGYINDKLFSNQFNLSLLKLPLEKYLSGYQLLKCGIFFQNDLLKCI